MATALLSNPYTSQAGSHYGYVQQPQGPPSPPMDDASKCSLPSISNLLDLADQGSPTSETSPQSQQMQHQSSQQQQQVLQQSAEFSFNSQPSRPSTRPNSSHFSSNPMGLRGGVLPPTPPMTSEASFSGYDSPSTKSVNQLPTSASVAAAAAAAATNNYYFEATPPPQFSHESTSEPRHNSQPPSSHPQQYQQQQHQHSHHHQHQQPQHHHQHQHHHHQPQPQRSVPVQTATYSAPVPAFASTVPQSYMSQPAAAAMYYPAMQPTPPPQTQLSGLYYQRPLPQTFPPLSVAVQPSPWQHHHYISPSAAAAFPQSQDRYICPTCNKAFSRPSSLRIHSHSHTGEKPFKCPHQGCGKAFSVRSNMKRHERGCHNYDSGN